MDESSSASSHSPLPEKKAKKERRRSTFGQGRVSIGNPAEIIPITPVDVSARKKKRMNSENPSLADIQAENERKMKLLSIYLEKLTTEQKNWNDLLSHCEQQTSDTELPVLKADGGSADNETVVHSMTNCACLSALSDDQRNVLASRPDYSRIGDLLQQFDETAFLADKTLSECTQRSVRHDEAIRDIAQQAISKLYKNCWQDCYGVDVGQNCCSWFKV